MGFISFFKFIIIIIISVFNLKSLQYVYNNNNRNKSNDNSLKHFTNNIKYLLKMMGFLSIFKFNLVVYNSDVT